MIRQFYRFPLIFFSYFFYFFTCNLLKAHRVIFKWNKTWGEIIKKLNFQKISLCWAKASKNSFHQLFHENSLRFHSIFALLTVNYHFFFNFKLFYDFSLLFTCKRVLVLYLCFFITQHEYGMWKLHNDFRLFHFLFLVFISIIEKKNTVYESKRHARY